MEKLEELKELNKVIKENKDNDKKFMNGLIREDITESVEEDNKLEYFTE